MGIVFSFYEFIEITLRVSLLTGC